MPIINPAINNAGILQTGLSSFDPAIKSGQAALSGLSDISKTYQNQRENETRMKIAEGNARYQMVLQNLRIQHEKELAEINAKTQRQQNKGKLFGTIFKTVAMIALASATGGTSLAVTPALIGLSSLSGSESSGTRVYGKGGSMDIFSNSY